MAEPPAGSTPQFGTAEFAGVAGAELCQFCHQPITHRYYQINNAMACPGCGERAQHSMPKDSHSQYIRGLALGIGGAIIGLAVYATFEIVSGFTIGYASLAVGYVVGKAIMLGSGGAGGRKYQITAVVLTYLAVCLAVVPVVIYEVRSHRSEQGQQVAQKSAPDATENQQPEQDDSGAPRPPRMSRTEALLRLSLIGLESPFLELSNNPFSGLLGLVILLVGIRIAWRICAGAPIVIDGPFENAPAVS